MSAGDDDIFGRIARQLWERQQYSEEQEYWLAQKSDLDERIKAYELLDRLLRKYEQTSMDEHFHGQTVENDYGQAYRIERRFELSFSLPGKHKAEQMLMEDLTLLYEVRRSRAAELRAQGYRTLEDLADHHGYGALARTIVEMIKGRDAPALMRYIRTRHRLSSWQMYLCTAFFEPGDLLFFDLETTGLMQNTIILIGMGYYDKGTFVVEQLLVPSQEDEGAALWEFFRRASRFKALVSFNGRSFDQNMVNKKSVYNYLDYQLDMPHFDVLLFARKAWPQLEKHNLKILEKNILDMERQDDVPSSLVPDFYYKYEETGNIGPLVPIVYHNRLDILSTARLFGELKKYLVND